MKRLLFAFLAVMLFALPYVAPAVTAAPLEQVPNCLFFTQTGSGNGGFSVCDDGQAQFRTAYQRWGLQQIGYPVSRRYTRDGFVTQAFQKAIMQWRADSSSVVLVNIFDDLHNDGFDTRLLQTRQTPVQLPDGWDGDIPFNQVLMRRQGLLNERPALRTAYFAASDPITFFGLPTSEVEDMGNHYAIRLQRAVLQEWKEDVPWARAGQVTIANGGDIAKELGGLPASALTPEPSAPTTGATPVPQPTTAPGTPVPAPTATTAPTTGGPTGTILMTSNRESFDDIWSVNADGTGLKRLTTMGQAYDAHFSPDGRTIVFSHNADIWKMNADGSGQVNITNSPEQVEAFPVVSPNGSKIAYLFGWQGGFEIYTMNMDGTARTAITSRNFDWMPSWSPDGTQITFSSARSGSFNIWVVNAAGDGLRQVTNYGGERIAISPVYSPNGADIAFSTLTATTSWEIWKVGAGGGDGSRVVGAIGTDPNNSAIIAAWKGDRFLLRGYEGNWDPYFVSQSGGAPTRVPLGDKDDKPSDWRP